MMGRPSQRFETVRLINPKYNKLAYGQANQDVRSEGGEANKEEDRELEVQEVLRHYKECVHQRPDKQPATT